MKVKRRLATHDIYTVTWAAQMALEISAYAHGDNALSNVGN